MKLLRAVVNVATHHYVPGQERLVATLPFYSHSSLLTWNEIPSYWPSHKQKPYAFKAYALKCAAEQGHDLLLWMDASVVPIRDLEPLWKKIETEGYWIAKNGWTNYEWTCDAAYPYLFPGIPLAQAREINKTFPQVVATSFGLNLKHPQGRDAFDQYFDLAANTTAFCGPWSNTNNPNHWPQDETRQGPCGPPDVLGHRHDQTALAVIAWRLKMKLTQCPEIFAYPPAGENTILLCKGA